MVLQVCADREATNSVNVKAILKVPPHSPSIQPANRKLLELLTGLGCLDFRCQTYMLAVKLLPVCTGVCL